MIKPPSRQQSSATSDLIAGLTAASAVTWDSPPFKQESWSKAPEHPRPPRHPGQLPPRSLLAPDPWRNPSISSSPLDQKWGQWWSDFQALDAWLETKTPVEQATAWDELRHHNIWGTHLHGRWQPVDVWIAAQHVRFIGEVSGPQAAHTLTQITYAPKDTAIDNILGSIGLAQLSATLQRMDQSMVVSAWISLSDHLALFLERLTDAAPQQEQIALVSALASRLHAAAEQSVFNRHDDASRFDVEHVPSRAWSVTRDWPLGWIKVWAEDLSSAAPAAPDRMAISHRRQLSSDLTNTPFAPACAPPLFWKEWATQSEDVCRNTWLQGPSFKVFAADLDTHPDAWTTWMTTLADWPHERAKPFWPSGLRLLNLHTDVVSAETSVNTLQTWLKHTPLDEVQKQAPEMILWLWHTALSDIAVVDAFENQTWAILDLLEWMRKSSPFAEDFASHCPAQVNISPFLSIAGLDASKKCATPFTSDLWVRLLNVSHSAHPSVHATLVALSHAVGNTDTTPTGASVIPMVISQTNLNEDASSAWLSLQQAALEVSTAGASVSSAPARKM